MNEPNVSLASCHESVSRSGSARRTIGTSRKGGSSARAARVLALVAALRAVRGVSALAAQASTYVPPQARVYADIDALTQAGLIDTLSGSVRPYTRVEIERLLAEARRAVATRTSQFAWAERLIERNVERYASPTRIVDYAFFDVTTMDSPVRPVPTDFNGSMDAAVNPLAAWRGGRPVANGQTATVETMHSASLGRHVAIAVSPRLTTERVRGGTGAAMARLQTANVSMVFGNLAAEVGRDYAVFGPAPTGGLLLSVNAPSLDMVRISTQRPAALPWVFRRMGPASATLFIADLGVDHQIHPHAKLVGYHMAIAPRRNLELGVEVLDQTGGRGGPPGSFADRVLDAIPPIDAWRTGSDFQFSNKLAGVDARWRIPDWAGLELYAEGAVDDMDIRRLRSSLLDDGGLIGGISLSCLVECGRFAARFEYHQTGIRYYTHTEFASGMQAHGIMLGDPLGPRGLGGYASLESNAGGIGKIGITGGYEIRSGNRYGSAGGGSHSANFHFVQIEHRPGERRGRLVADWTSTIRGGRADLTVSAGVERTASFDFTGASRTSALAEVGYRLWP